MQNVNLQLRSAYYDLLHGNVKLDGVDVPIYYLNVTQGDPDVYVLLSSIQSTERSAGKCLAIMDNSLVFTVYTRYEKNGGAEVDSIVDQMLNIIYPGVSSKVPGTKSINVVNDVVTGGFNAAKNLQICERTLTIQHIFNHF